MFSLCGFLSLDVQQFRTRRDRFRGPPRLLYNEYRVIPEGKAAGSGGNNPPHLAPRLKKEYSYTSTPPLGLLGLFYGEIYLFTFF